MVTSSRTRRLDLGRQRPHICDRALDFPDPDEVPIAERTRVGDGQPAHHLIDDAARAERNHQADEHAHTLERLRIATREIWIRDDESDEPQERRDEPSSRLCRFRIDPGDRTRPCSTASKSRFEPHHQARSQQDDEGREQRGQRMDELQRQQARSGSIRNARKASPQGLACTGNSGARRSARHRREAEPSGSWQG